MALTFTTDGSFNSVAFWEQDDEPGRRKRPAIRAQTQDVHYPGTNSNKTVSGGLLHQEFEKKVLATTSNLNSLEGLVDSSHSLVYSGGTVTAYLAYAQDREDVLNAGVGTIVLGFKIT